MSAATDTDTATATVTVTITITILRPKKGVQVGWNGNRILKEKPKEMLSILAKALSISLTTPNGDIFNILHNFPYLPKNISNNNNQRGMKTKKNWEMLNNYKKL